MIRDARPAVRVLFLLAVSTLVGCNNSGLTKTEETSVEHLALRELGEGYRLHQIAFKKPPTKLSDLARVEGVGANGIEAVRKGELVIRMGATLPDTGEEPGKVASSEVLAYEKKVEQGEGYVLLLDRTVKKMTAEEFKSATKAGTEAPVEKAAKK